MHMILIIGALDLFSTAINRKLPVVCMYVYSSLQMRVHLYNISHKQKSIKMYVTNNQANKELTTSTILDRGYDGGGVTKIQSSSS